MTGPITLVVSPVSVEDDDRRLSVSVVMKTRPASPNGLVVPPPQYAGPVVVTSMCGVSSGKFASSE